MGATKIEPTNKASVVNPLTPEQDVRFQEAADYARKVLGSYDAIAQALEPMLGRRLLMVTVRRWMVSRTLPVRMAFALVKAVNEKLPPGETISVEDFHPWLAEYL